MAASRWLSISLARRMSLLFGSAVLLTIIATLAFPWMQMNALEEQRMLLTAQQCARAAYQAVDLAPPDWTAAQQLLTRRWPQIVDELGFAADPPALVPVDSFLVGRDGFRRAAIAYLQRNPNERWYRETQGDGSVFRLAMAVRARETEPHPQVLRGVVDVRLSIPKTAGTWNTLVTVLAGASGAVLAILAFYLVTQRLVLRPVDQLRHVAQQVTTGDLEVRASIESGDEFQQLSEAFNDMLAHLKHAQDELRTINRSLDVRLGELAEINVGLYESNRLKNDFLANVSHELRTPLVSIIGFAELLRDAWENPKADRTRLARYSENILISGRSLLEIINDLLDLAKIEAGRLELHITTFSLAQLCEDLIDFVKPLADKRNQQLTLSVAEDLPECTSDSGRIKQVLYNLLSNAIKFTPSGGSVQLTAERVDEKHVRLDVVDSGPGIAKDKQESIFEKFRQLDSSRTREHEGTGLGLAITRELVQMLSGRIELQSEEGAGATFRVFLPTVVQPPANATSAKGNRKSTSGAAPGG
jgi:two-component system sensor histidine kinase BarA